MKKQRKNAGSILRMAVALSLAATLLPLPAYAKTHYEGTHSSPNEAGRTLVLLVVTATGIALIAAIFNYIVKRKKND